MSHVFFQPITFQLLLLSFTFHSTTYSVGFWWGKQNEYEIVGCKNIYTIVKEAAIYTIKHQIRSTVTPGFSRGTRTILLGRQGLFSGRTRGKIRFSLVVGEGVLKHSEEKCFNWIWKTELEKDAQNGLLQAVMSQLQYTPAFRSNCGKLEC